MNAIFKFVMAFLAKKSGKAGITTIPKASGLNVELTVKQITRTLENMGVDVSKIKSTKEVEKFLNIHQSWLTKQGQGSTIGKKSADVLDLTGKKIPPGSQIMGGKEVKIDIVADTIATIKSKKPIDAMAEANSVIGRKGKYKKLTPEESKKILKDTEDHIFQRDVPPEDFAGGGRTGFFTGALADTKQGKSMSPGTSADYSPGQGHRATADANKQLAEIVKMHNMKAESMEIKPPKRSIREKIGGGINRVLNNPLVRGYAAWGTGGLSEKLRASMIAKHLYDRRNILGDEEIEEEISNIPTMGGIKPAYAQGGRTSTGLNYLLGEDDQNVRVPYGLGGGFNAARRAFLKIMGAGAATGVAAKSGLFSLLKAGKPAAQVLTSVPIKAGVDGMPAWFKPLVNKVIKEGDDVTKKLAEADRQIVHTTKLPNSQTDVIVTQDLTSGNVSVDIGIGKHGFSAGHHGQPVRLEYKAAEDIMTGPDADDLWKIGERDPHVKTKSRKELKTKEEFWVEEAEFTGGHPENVKFEESAFEKFGEHGTDFTEVEKFATGKVKKAKPLRKREITEYEGEKAQADAERYWEEHGDYASGGRVPLGGGKLVLEGLLALGKGAAKGEGKFTKSEVLIQMLENTLKGSKDSWTKINLPNFIKEIKANPKLANEPKVWNYFTKGLPKNQRLVVYSDDTVDFWRQSKFGPHNIETTNKFLEKHPYLKRDQAVKIQNMEPEDQILEMKRLETIRDRSRTKHASGGLAGMLGE